MTGEPNEPYDVIVIGAGHNGLASATILAERGLNVLVLEKNNYVGGMAGTREIFKGCRNEVGASCLFPIAQEILDHFDFEGNGVEFIDLPVMALNLAGPGNKPLIFYSKPFRQLSHILLHHGPRAMLGFVRLMKFCTYPAAMLDRFTPLHPPKNMDQLLAEAPDEKSREQLELAFSGSAMDLIDRFFPDKERHRSLRSMLAFAAIQSTYKGPYTPGSALCLVYTMAQDGSGGLMRRVKGGMGAMSEALERSFQSKGGELRLKVSVANIIVEDDKAVGVALKNGEEFRARVVLSNLDKPATFLRLLENETFPEPLVEKIENVEHRGAYVHLLFHLKTLPSFGGEWAHLNKDPNNFFGGAMVHDPELIQKSFEACRAGEVPEHVPVAFQIPSVLDASLAPKGEHIASAYGFYYPCDAPKEDRGRLRDIVAEKVIDQVSQYMPNFRDCIAEQAVFSSDHFAAMHGATNGDFTHGLLHPENMLDKRGLVEGSAHKTPVENLYMCGASCHPGPGVTFLPGYNCAHEVIRDVFDRPNV